MRDFLLSCFGADIFRCTRLFLDWDHVHPMPWVPVLDGAFAAEPIVPRDFREAVAAGQAASVPVIMGCCRDEGLILTPSFFKVPKSRGRRNKITKIWQCCPIGSVM
jgi:hypothetical protein